MFSRWFKPNHQRIRNSMAEEMGYNNAWLGLDKSNPFANGTPENKAYEWGYNTATDDIEEWMQAHNPFDVDTDELNYFDDGELIQSIARMQ